VKVTLSWDHRQRPTYHGQHLQHSTAVTVSQVFKVYLCVETYCIQKTTMVDLMKYGRRSKVSILSNKEELSIIVSYISKKRKTKYIMCCMANCIGKIGTLVKSSSIVYNYILLNRKDYTPIRNGLYHASHHISWSIRILTRYNTYYVCFKNKI